MRRSAAFSAFARPHLANFRCRAMSRSVRRKTGTGAAHYVRVKQYIRDRVASHELKLGERVPSEHELVRHFGLSRMTVNRALRELLGEGVITRIAGVGSFVAEARVHSHPLAVRNIADEIRARNHTYSAKVLALE